MAVVGIPSPAIKLAAASHHRSVVFLSPSKCRHLLPVKCSAEAAATTDEFPASSSSSDQGGAVITSGLGRPSIISTINVQKAMRGLPITDVDYYETLGVPRTATYDEIQLAYQSKCEELKNKEGLEEEDAKKELDLLKESYTILSIKEERRLYDWSLSRSAKPDRYVWPFETDDDSAKSRNQPPPEEPEDVGPTRLVGYFFLAWIILSFALSVTLNR